MKNRSVSILISTILVFVLMGWGDAHAIDYLDGRFQVWAKITQQLNLRTNKASWEIYDYDIANLRSQLKTELRWKAFQGAEYDLTFEGIFMNFYDTAHEVDTGTRRYLRDFSSSKRGFFFNQYETGGSKAIEEFKSYETFREICKELYVELDNPDWQLRLGKQIVSWGETTAQRMADVVNPLDGRGNINPATAEFDELKIGLWMAKLTLTPPDFYQSMWFEFYVIPDFQPWVNWPAGYHLLISPGFQGLNTPDEQFRAAYRDAPKSWSDPALGLRIGGETCGVTWTLFYLYHRSPQGNVFRDGMGLNLVLPALTGRGRAEDVIHFGHQSSFGFTFARPIDKTITLFPGTSLNMAGNNFRGEFLVEASKDHNNFSFELKSHNRYAFALAWETYIQIPYLTDWNHNSKMQSTTQLFMEWVPGKHRDDAIFPWVSYDSKGHHSNEITQFWRQPFWQERFQAVLFCSWKPYDGQWYYAPAIVFKPVFHWTYVVRYWNFKDYDNSFDSRDSIIFEISYDF